MTEKKRKKSDTADQFLVRMPEGLRARIAIAAFEHGRSMNAEVIEALEKAFPEIPGWAEFKDDIEFIVAAYKDRVNTSWSREALRSLMSTVAYQIAFREPDGSEPNPSTAIHDVQPEEE